MPQAAVPRTREEILGLAEALVPVLAERAARCEELRRCPEETIADLDAAELLRVCRPARFGGDEQGWDVLCEVDQILARGCASQAWVQSVFNDHAQLLGSFPLAAQEEVWGADPAARISASIDPAGRARLVPGGVLLAGRHGFASGIDHAQWVICGGMIEAAGRPPQRSYFLVPRSDGRVIDDWHVVGLAGTGSKTFELGEVFVPEHRILDFAAGEAGEGPGTAVNSAPVFRMPRAGFPSLSFAAISTGIAQGFLDEYLRFTRKRVSRGVPMMELAGTQIGVGAAAAEIAAASRLVLGTARDAMRQLEHGETLTAAQRSEARLHGAHTVRMSLHAVQSLFNAAGGRALFVANPMQRNMRDLNGVAAHHALSWDEAAAGRGAELLRGDATPP
jgi:3-hydroxy-9,10-secoandrosta-1,3,5(10)-triene-9,17-dione monooxygenase